MLINQFLSIKKISCKHHNVRTFHLCWSLGEQMPCGCFALICDMDIFSYAYWPFVFYFLWLCGRFGHYCSSCVNVTWSVFLGSCLWSNRWGCFNQLLLWHLDKSLNFSASLFSICKTGISTWTICQQKHSRQQRSCSMILLPSVHIPAGYLPISARPHWEYPSFS